MKMIQNPRICTFLIKGEDGGISGHYAPYACPKCGMISETEKCPRCGSTCNILLH